MQKLLLSALLLLLTCYGAVAQLTVKGRVTDDTGAPIGSATIVVKGTNFGTTSDKKGYFTFNCPPDSKTISVTSLGYVEKLEAIVKDELMTIVMVPDKQDMDQVVVVAYGTAKKVSLTGSVGTVTANQLEKRPFSNPLAVLEGANAGVQVNNTVGQPGAGPEIRIRGFSSVNYGNGPLYVIDHVPFTGDIADINPADIESISILKDAASSGLYGNRASNGVVIMTTKRGSRNSSAVNFTMNHGFYDKGINEYDRMGPNDYMETMWKGYRNSLRTNNNTAYPTDAIAGQRATQTLISDYLHLNIYDRPANALFDADGKLVAGAQILPGYAEDLNWNKGFERLGQRSDYNLNARTGNDKNSLYFSTGYLNEKGYTKYSDFKRFSARVNADLQATKWFKYGLNVSGTYQLLTNTPAQPSDATEFSNPIYFARNIAPIYPVHRHDAATGEYLLDASGNKQYDNGDGTRNQYIGRHSIWENELSQLSGTKNTLITQAYANITFLKNFTFSIVGDMNTRSDDQLKYNNAVIGDGLGNNGRSVRTSYHYLNYTGRQTLTWSQKFMNVHIVDVLAGHESFNSQYTYSYAYKIDETFAGQPDLSNFNTITNLTGYRDTYRTEGYFGRARYNYKDQYFLEASARRDGGSKFYRPWETFYSVGASWVISKEKFFDPLAKNINFLKLRTSYGRVGSDTDVPLYAWMSLYEMRQNANRAALIKSQNSSYNLRWEESASIGAALEGRIFNRANVVVEYFDKQSRNLIFDINQPLSAGATTNADAEAITIANIGSVSNKGWELTFDVDVIKTKDFRFNFGGNATFMKNQVQKLAAENRDGIIDGNKKVMVGRGIYEFWLPQFAGVDQMTGNALYHADTVKYSVTPGGTDPIPVENLVTINGTTYTTNASYARRDWSGSAIPKIFGAFNTTFTYKNLTLAGIFTYALGGKTYDNSYSALMSMSGTVSSLHKNLLNSWNGVPEGMTEHSENRIDPNGLPVVDFARSNLNNAASNRFLQNGSYLVIKNINLSYRFPAQTLRRLEMKSLVAGVTGENLYTGTKLRGMNPQQNFNGTSTNLFVTPRVVSFFLNVGL